MTTNGDQRDSLTTRLATYEVNGDQRELYAVQVPGEPTLNIIDVLARPRAEDGDLDERQVEDGLTEMCQAQAIADDYAAVGTRVGRCPMEGLWW